MSFTLEAIIRTSQKAIFFIFFFLAALGALSCFFGLTFLKKNLYEADREFAYDKTKRYMKKSGLGGGAQKHLRFSIQDVNELGDLVFVRLTRHGEHLLIVNETHASFDLGELLHLSESSKNEWVFSGSYETPFVIIRHQVANGVALQVGVVAAHYETYKSFKNGALFFLIIYILLVALLSLFIVRLSQMPIKKTSDQIAEMAEQATQLVLSEYGNGESLDNLHKQINKLVQQNRRLVTEIQGSLDNVAHDLRTPVTRLRSVAEYGLQNDDRNELRSALADCLEESEQIAAMLKVMMSVAEAESGTMNLELSSAELSAGLTDVIDLYEYVAEDKKVTINLETTELLYVNIDSVRMRQVWANLLDNALKYGRVGGHVQIALARQGEDAVVCFEDNGIGISRSEQHKIWERLYRGDRSRSEKGLGLGLNYVKAVVEAHGGSVSVKSVLNEGTVFKVRLPRSIPILTE